MDYAKMALELHKQYKGKLAVTSRVPLATRDDLSTAYTPGVAAPCLAIKENPEDVYTYTSKGNLIAVVSDGSAVLGLGNIGAKAAMPVMEGKAVLFGKFAGIDAVPICLDTQDTEEIIRTVKYLAPCFGGINLEDISAPRCFEIEDRLKEMLDIPVFHDDQHGTAVVVAAALINALKVVGKQLSEAKIVLCGFGAAGSAITRLLYSMGGVNFTVVDKDGIMTPAAATDSTRRQILEKLNPENRKGTLADALVGADIFIGVSAPGIVTAEMVSTMNHDAIIFAMANPTPEIMPDLAKSAGAKVVGTGRSDFPNQVNNSLAFPAIFRGALDARAKQITEEMKIAAVYALAGLITDNELHEENIIPSMFDPRVVPAIAQAVGAAYKE